MQKTLKIQTSGPKSNWTAFIKANRFNPGISIDELFLDFQKCSFLEPFHIVALACLIEEYHLNGTRITFLSEISLELNEYLNNIKLFHYWEPGFDRNKFTPTSIKSNLCLWKLDSSMVSSFVDQAAEYFRNHFLTGINTAPISIALAEIFNNINDHADSPVSGYCLCQFYPSSSKIKIAVCDFGEGIPNVVYKYLKSNQSKLPSDDLEAIKLSLQNSFSTKSQPHNRGFGLDTIITIVNSCNGSLRLTSNKGNLILKEGVENSFCDRSSFGGTHIEIVLDTKQFDPIESSLENEDFTF